MNTGMSATTESEKLTVTEIIRALGKDTEAEGKKMRSVISRYLEDEETRALLGASGPVRPVFPKEAVPVFNALLMANAAGEVTPKTGGGWLARHFSPNHSAATPILTNPSILANSGNTPVAELVQVMREFIQTVKDIAPAPEDRVLTRSQAAALLACAPSTVSRFVRPLRRGAYRRSDCLRYIETNVPVITATAKAPVASLTMMVENPAAQTAEVIETTEVDWYALNIEAETQKQNKRLSEIENWLRAKMITPGEAKLLRRAEDEGRIDGKDLDKLFKVKQRVREAEELAKPPNVAEEDQKH